MKKSIFLLCFLLMGLLSMAQINMSGTWVFSKSKSKQNAEFSMAPVKLVIQHEGNVMKLERHSEFQGNQFTSNAEYTLDGKECVNDGWQDMKIKSVCSWDNDQKVLTVKSKIPTQDGSEMALNEAYSLVNGDLSILSKASSSWGDFQETWVFEKQ